MDPAIVINIYLNQDGATVSSGAPHAAVALGTSGAQPGVDIPPPPSADPADGPAATDGIPAPPAAPADEWVSPPPAPALPGDASGQDVPPPPVADDGPSGGDDVPPPPDS